MRRVAIIGTAGRTLQDRLTRLLYQRMVETTRELILSEDVVVSGGAAWADHVAVTLFLTGKCQGLELYLPCEWDKTQYVDNGHNHWAKNPGRLANQYHRAFSKAVGIDSLEQIARAIESGATIHVHSGFHARNTLVATTCDKMIALTWASDGTEIVGGTKDTWDKCKLTSADKKHICLLELE